MDTSESIRRPIIKLSHPPWTLCVSLCVSVCVCVCVCAPKKLKSARVRERDGERKAERSRWRERERESPSSASKPLSFMLYPQILPFLKVQTPGSDSYVLIYSSSIFPPWSHPLSSPSCLLPFLPSSLLSDHPPFLVFPSLTCQNHRSFNSFIHLLKMWRLFSFPLLCGIISLFFFLPLFSPF